MRKTYLRDLTLQGKIEEHRQNFLYFRAMMDMQMQLLKLEIENKVFCLFYFDPVKISVWFFAPTI